jgi:hypothetical protein
MSESRNFQTPWILGRILEFTPFCTYDVREWAFHIRDPCTFFADTHHIHLTNFLILQTIRKQFRIYTDSLRKLENV